MKVELKEMTEFNPDFMNFTRIYENSGEMINDLNLIDFDYKSVFKENYSMILKEIMFYFESRFKLI